MNIGIQDSVSPTEPLTKTLRDGARLVIWAAERHRVATDVAALTHRMPQLATMESPTAQILRNAVIALAGHVPAVHLALARTLAELDA
jgi:2-polyprenyl-6-methoxyphenol hydroxylase-like FAD-dependent oxidoreductase